ncbi:hypothetical protein E8P82_00140 [Arthrobacter echini]|uniref:DUF559 domain-containing protein n=1 Tax=Arthrobacter echini TaxID=1529066 RepID=A0A4S5E9M8_9MICC|nr:type IV toxin-antitoxin system AbiEi family antitoxin domain-containing protein [Arthrobacter echini]THJ68368.1 hypothetical protein E8P82_00140 [Arthrobacter echini]
MDVVDVLTKLGGVARTRELVAAGASTSALARACSGELIVRAARGIYALPGGNGDLLAARCSGAELSCISAAQQRGLWVLRPPTLLHVSVDHGRFVPSSRLRLHRARLPLSTLSICIQCARCVPQLDALCVVESAVVLGLVDLAELRTAAGSRRAGALRHVIELIDPHSQSVLETVARYHLVEAGFTVASQVHVGGVGRIDLFVDGVLGIEADGREFHSERREFEEDRRRWNLLTTKGVPILRVSRNLLLNQPAQFIHLVTSALASHSPQR